MLLLDDDDMTVEEYLTAQCNQITAELQQHGAMLIEKLRQECIHGTTEIRNMMRQATSSKFRMILKIIIKLILILILFHFSFDEALCNIKMYSWSSFGAEV